MIIHERTAPPQRARSAWARRAALATILGASAFFASARAHAELPSDCPALGVALTDHTCFHATNGPFAPVTAVTIGAGSIPPGTDQPHTLYEISLPEGAVAGRVSYAPANASRAGTWAVFHPLGVQLSVRASSGVALAPLLRTTTVPCAALPAATVFELPVERVEVTIDGGGRRRVLLAFEALTDFVAFQGRDADGDGHGGPVEVITSPCAPIDGYGVDDADCDDADPTVFPGAAETCDARDRNCNGVPGDVGLPCASGVGACGGQGTFSCPANAPAPVCSAAPRQPSPETCDGIDNDCDGLEDREDAQACPLPSAPRCIATGTGRACGCAEAVDCGGGRVCDEATRQCVNSAPNAQGGSTGAAGAASPPTSGASGDGGAGGAGERTPAPAGSDAGCGCAVPAPASSGNTHWLALAAILALSMRRRHASLFGAAAVVSLAGCGGMVEEQKAPLPVCGLRARPEVQTHACQHAERGPFDDGAAPRDLSGVHRTYRFLPNAGPTLGTYRATRAGAHVVFTDGMGFLEVIAEGGAALEVTRTIAETSCARFTSAFVVELAAGARYDIRASAGEKGGSVFFEHAASFAGGGVETVCAPVDSQGP